MGNIAPTYGVQTASASFRSRVKKVQFDDGYVSRAKMGINTLVKVWSVTFTPGTAAAMLALESTLVDDMNFNITYWQAPDENAQTAWFVNSVSKTLQPGGLVELTCELERAFQI